MQTAESKKVVTIVDKATKSLSKVATDAAKVITDLHTLVEQSNQVAFDIELKSGELKAIDDSVVTRTREAEADLKIAIKENEDKVLRELLAKNKLEWVTVKAYESLVSELADALGSNEKQLEEAINKAIQSQRATHQIQLTKLQAEHDVQTADLKSTVSALTSKVAYLQEANAAMQKTLDEEREARVKIAQNTAQPTINVGG